MQKMQLVRRAQGSPYHLAILPGTFNPVTVAHLGLAHAALGTVDEVLFVLPRSFPHKIYEGAGFRERIGMLEDALAGEPRFSIAASDGGLFREIAEECRAIYGGAPRLSFLCGRDAAERIVGWDYGDPGAVARMFRDFGLLVAARGGAYAVPAHLRDSVTTLPVGDAYEGVSATEVRRRIAAGEDWTALVPAAIHERVRRAFPSTA